MVTTDSQQPPVKRRDLHRRKWSWSVLVVAPVSFAAGAILNPLASQAVERWGSPFLQGIDNTIGRSALYVKETSWPWQPCGNGTAAVMPEGPAAETLIASAQGLDPFLLTESGVTVVWGRASMTILLSATQPEDTLLIESITPRVYKFTEGQAPWTTTPPGSACGGLDQRSFLLNLQTGRGTITDQGILKGPGEGPLPAKVPSESLGHAFTVAQDDAAEITLAVTPQDGYYEFGLEISYSINGQSQTTNLGSSEDPYRAGGGTAVQSYRVDYKGKLTK